MNSSNPNWSDVARAYSQGECTVAQICTQFGVSKSSLYRQARLNKWPPRMNTAQSSYNDFVESMFYVLYKQLDQVESRISSDGPVDAVALGNIAKTFEKLIELREAGKAPNKTRIESTAASALREMLSKNLERLNEQD